MIWIPVLLHAMPIHPTIYLSNLEQDEFDLLDAEVMRHAYITQNKLGRLFHESIYENELAATLRAAGLDVSTQVAVRLIHGSFHKTYFLDLVVEHMIYEIKATTALVPEHEAQALNYAMLMDVSRAKLVNFGGTRVQGKLCFNPVRGHLRRLPRLETGRWTPESAACERLLQHLRELLTDWGTHLSSSLYNEALVHLSGGETHCCQRVRVGDLGTQSIQSHSPRLAFVLTSFTRGVDDYRRQLSRLVRQLDILALHWFNMNHNSVLCESISAMQAKD